MALYRPTAPTPVATSGWMVKNWAALGFAWQHRKLAVIARLVQMLMSNQISKETGQATIASNDIHHN